MCFCVITDNYISFLFLAQKWNTLYTQTQSFSWISLSRQYFFGALMFVYCEENNSLKFLDDYVKLFFNNGVANWFTQNIKVYRTTSLLKDKMSTLTLSLMRISHNLMVHSVYSASESTSEADIRLQVVCSIFNYFCSYMHY